MNGDANRAEALSREGGFGFGAILLEIPRSLMRGTSLIVVTKICDSDSSESSHGDKP